MGYDNTNKHVLWNIVTEMILRVKEKTTCPVCGSLGAVIDEFGYVECRRCLFYGQPRSKARRDEFGDEIDNNERRTEWAW